MKSMTFGRFDYAAFLTFFAYAAGSVVTPVALVALAHDLNFSLERGGMTAGGALQLGRTSAIVVAMLLCGFAAGRWGKRLTLGWSVILMGAGLGIAALAPAYGLLFAALAITGIGEGVVEGLATPLIQDLHPVEPGRHLNISHAFWPIGILATVLVSGALLAYGISWRWITGMVALLSLIPAALLLLPVRAGGHACPEHPEPLHWKTVRNQAVAILRIPRFWVFFASMFLAGGGEFCLTFWSASHVQLKYGASAWAGGICTAGFAAGMILGRLGWGYALRQRHLKNLILISALGGTAVTVFLPIPSHLGMFFALLFLAGIATAPLWPSLQSLGTDRLPGVDTTMLLILLSCAGVPGCGFFTWLMGYLGNRSGSLSNAFLLVPGCYLAIAVLLIAMDHLPARPRHAAGMAASCPAPPPSG